MRDQSYEFYLWENARTGTVWLRRVSDDWSTGQRFSSPQEAFAWCETNEVRVDPHVYSHTPRQKEQRLHEASFEGGVRERLREMHDEPDLSYLLGPMGTIRAIGHEDGPEPPMNGIARYRSPEGSYRYVYYVSGEPVSALQVMTRDKKHGRIANVWTVPHARRYGYATKLLQQARKDFKTVEHSDDLSTDAVAWIDQVGERQLRETPPPETNTDLPDAAICVIFDDHGRVLTVSRPEPPHEQSIPGGVVDPGENPAQTVVRELREECAVDPRDPVHAGIVRSPTDGRRVHVFVANGYRGTARAAEPATRIAWLSPQQLLAQARLYRSTVHELMAAGLLGEDTDRTSSLNEAPAKRSGRDGSRNASSRSRPHGDQSESDRRNGLDHDD